VKQKQIRTLFGRNMKVWRFVITKEMIHAYLGYNIVAIIQQLRGTTPQIKGRSGKSTYICDWFYTLH
jgi:hypothetical protein